MRAALASSWRRSSAKMRRSISSRALLRGQDLYFELFEFGRREALGVHQRLLALVVGGDGLGVGLGDLEVVAEDGVEAHLERADAGAFALALFDGGDALAAGRREAADGIEILVNAFADGAAVGEMRRAARRPACAR